MKRNSVFLTFVLLELLFMFGCAALTEHGQLERDAREHYEAGRFDKAVFDCASSLRIKPEYEKSQILIQDAFRAATRSHVNKISTLKASADKFKWDSIVREYEGLVQVNQVVSELPTLKKKDTEEIIIFETKNYTDELADAKNKAAEAHYQEGLELIKEQTVDTQKQAAKEFKKAMGFVPDYQDAATLYEKARKSGTKRIAIVPFEDKSGKQGKYGDVPGMIVDDVVSKLMEDQSSMEFLEIVSRNHLDKVMQEQKMGLTGLIDKETAIELGRILGVHEIITGKITTIIHIPEKTIRKSEKKKARVVIRKEKYKDSEGKTKTKNIYGDVHARATICTKTAGAKISGSYKIIDIKTAKLIKSQSFTGKCDFKYMWATYSGDERALDGNTKKLASREEKRAPVAGELVYDASKNLSKSIVETLKGYVR